MVLATPLSAAGTERIPTVGLEGPEADACVGIGRISVLAEMLEVFPEPDEYVRKKGELPRNTLVWLCEGEDGWQGIVYPTGEFQELEDCRVSTPVAEPHAYAGPCQYGWVLARHLQLVMG